MRAASLVPVVLIAIATPRRSRAAAARAPRRRARRARERGAAESRARGRGPRRRHGRRPSDASRRRRRHAGRRRPRGVTARAASGGGARRRGPRRGARRPDPRSPPPRRRERVVAHGPSRATPTRSPASARACRRERDEAVLAGLRCSRSARWRCRRTSRCSTRSSPPRRRGSAPRPRRRSATSADRPPARASSPHARVAGARPRLGGARRGASSRWRVAASAPTRARSSWPIATAGARTEWFARAALATAVAALDADPVPVLDRLVADEDARVSSAAAVALIRCGRPGEVVRRAFPTRGPAEGARRRGGRRRRRGARRRSAPRLRGLAAADPDRAVRWSAALALSRLDDPAGDALLVAGLSSNDPQVWASAIAECRRKTGLTLGRDADAWADALAARRKGGRR